MFFEAEGLLLRNGTSPSSNSESSTRPVPVRSFKVGRVVLCFFCCLIMFYSGFYGVYSDYSMVLSGLNGQLH